MKKSQLRNIIRESIREMLDPNHLPHDLKPGQRVYWDGNEEILPKRTPGTIIKHNAGNEYRVVFHLPGGDKQTFIAHYEIDPSNWKTGRPPKVFRLNEMDGELPKSVDVWHLPGSNKIYKILVDNKKFSINEFNKKYGTKISDLSSVIRWGKKTGVKVKETEHDVS
jgi:hypothetical protein